MLFGATVRSVCRKCVLLTSENLNFLHISCHMIQSKAVLAGLNKSGASDYITIAVGAFIEAISYVLFFAPYKVIPGGVYGITIVLHYITKGLFSWMPEGLPMGTTALFFNVPLMLLAAKCIGLKSGVKTIVTFVLVAFFTDLLTTLTGGRPLVENDMVLSSFYGGVTLGIGVALVFRAGGTNAGTDVLARIIAMKSGMKLGTLIIIVDSCIVLMGLISFHDWAIPLYSWFAIFLYGRVVQALQVENPNRMVIIVSEHTEELRQVIIDEMHIGGTFLHGKGMHKGTEREIILTVADRSELGELMNRVKQIDPQAFISSMKVTKELRYDK